MSISRKIVAVVFVGVALVTLSSLCYFYYYSKHDFLQSELSLLQSQTQQAVDQREIFLSHILQSDKFKDEYHYLYDLDNSLIEVGTQPIIDGENTVRRNEFDNDLLSIISQDFGTKVQVVTPILLHDKEYQTLIALIEPMGWRYISLVPTEQILQPIQQAFTNALFFALSMMFLLLVFIRYVVKKSFVSPLVNMTNRTLSYAAGETSIEKLVIPNHDEIGRLNNALNSMHQKLAKDNGQLLDSERRYRQVVTSINEVIIQVNADGHWQFLSPIWKKLSGYELHASLNKPACDFFHPADQAYVNEVIKLLLANKQRHWSGELRLKCFDNRYIWVQLSLQTNRDMDSTLLSGTIENNHLQHVNQSVGKLIREAEQKVLTSRCSITSLLGFITKGLLPILNVQLVWVKVCKDNNGQVLSYAGEVSDFLFEHKRTWSGLHHPDGPVIASVKGHTVVRITSSSELTDEWRQRLEFDDIKDSLFLPFYLAGGETFAVIGIHSHDANVFSKEIQQIMTDFTVGLRLICQMAEDHDLMRLHRAAVEKTANAIMITDNFGRIEWVNDAFVKQTLFQLDEVMGRSPKILNSGSSQRHIISEMWAEIKLGHVWSGELVNRRKDGTLFSIHQTITPLLDEVGNITHFVAVSEDISERNEHQKRIAFMATHDELTKLPNRTLLKDRLQLAIINAKRQQGQTAVLVIDIDHFKYINDSLGHQIGDGLLTELATRLTAVLRQSDTVARFGGDEFVVVLPEIVSTHDIDAISANLLAEIKRPYMIMEHELMITGSIGISLYPNDALTADDLIQNADSAMYKAKELGRNNSQFFTAEINEKITRRLNLEKALRQALDRDEFILLYQPKVDLISNKITGAEALIRWQHPELGLVSPAEFIPLAEETGIIVELGEWVMQTACRQMQKWDKPFPELINMSINVSPRQFWQQNFTERVSSVLKETNVSPDKIELELTENVVVNDIELAIDTMVLLKETGVLLSIDDFGTGYSSLSYLQRFPVDVLKIDQAFIADLLNEQADGAIVRSIIALAVNFNLRVVAEGIETKEQQDIVTSLGCNYGQGYFFSRPVNAYDMAALLEAQKKAG